MEKTVRRFINNAIALVLITILVGACNNAGNSDSSKTTNQIDSSADGAGANLQSVDNANSQSGLNVADSSAASNSTATRECLTNWRGCGARGSTQATYNVRPDGTWEFKVFYCCGIGQCNQTGGGASTASGQVKHEEYSLSGDGLCLELVNRQYF